MEVLSVVVYTFNPSTWEAEAGRSLWAWGQPSLHSELQASQEHRETLTKKKNKQKKKKKKKPKTKTKNRGNNSGTHAPESESASPPPSPVSTIATLYLEQVVSFQKISQDKSLPMQLPLALS